MAAPQENDATLTVEAAAAGRWRLRQQWWWQKQWDDNNSNNQQQRLQCGPGIVLLSRTATDAMPAITAMAATDRMTKITTTDLDKGWCPWQRQQWLKHDGGGDGGRNDNGGRQQSMRRSSGSGKKRRLWWRQEQSGSSCGSGGSYGSSGSG